MTTPALIVETGAIVANADSFVTQADFATYAASLGVVLGTVEAQKLALRNAAIYIGTFEPRLKGDKVERGQPLSYPRQNLILENFDWSDDEIPRQVQLCQMQLAIDINAGIDLYNLPASPSTSVKREKVDGAVEVEYAVNNSMKLSRNSTSRALLSTLLKDGGLSVVRLLRA
jgi:hypothetical protein